MLFDQSTYDKLIAEVPKYKMITTSILSDRLRVSFSTFCLLLRKNRDPAAQTDDALPPPVPFFNPLLQTSQLNGSLARAAIRELLQKGLIKPIAEHGQQKIYTRGTAA